MKILNRNRPLSESKTLEEKSNFLFESFNRCPTKEHFLRENKNVENAGKLYNRLALTEAMEVNQDGFFLFESGIKLPSIGSKLSPELSIRRMFESASDENEFVELVESKIMQPCFENDLTAADKKELKEAFKRNK